MKRLRILSTLRRGNDKSPAVYWGAVGIVVIGFALLCWNQIARTLAAPIEATFAMTGSDDPFHAPHGGSATVADTGVATANFALTHVSATLQWLVAGDIAVNYVLTCAVLLAVGVIWVRTSAGKPFARVITRTLWTLAILVAVLGTGHEVLGSLITNREGAEAFGAANHSGGGYQITGGSIFLGLTIAVVASAFAIGARLTKDTEGLV